MKKRSSEGNLSANNRASRHGTDDTEKSFSAISKKFGEVISLESSSVKVKIKAKLREEMNHVSANSERLIHGKA